MKRFVRIGLLAAAVGAVVLGLAAVPPQGRVGYLARAGWFQAELLAGRVPLERARAGFDAEELERVGWIDDVKAYGRKIGLSSTQNYGTINPTWKRTIYNVSAADPVSFRTVSWWFPIVGRVPYLGFFRVEDARSRAVALRGQGYDVYVRTAGAYSTLGWFRDPVLPPMLKWKEERLADTLLHELAHATLWVPGSVKFNESFANFVGMEASMRYLVDKYGADAPEVRAAVEARADERLFVEVLHDTYAALSEVYDDPARSRGHKLRDKHVILGGIPARVAAAPFHDGDRYMKAAWRGPWNNARLGQFKTYNAHQGEFEALLAQVDGDLLAFIHRIDEITRGADDPFAALAEAVGGVPVADAHADD